jgi:sulfatase modifying factor 1
MYFNKPISRRKWLQLAGTGTLVFLLDGCKANFSTPPTANNPSPPATTTARGPIIPDMVWVDSGDFLMGSPTGEAAEQPVHPVNLTRGFYIGRYPVTFAEYDLYCEIAFKNKPADEGWSRDTRPVIYLNWNDAAGYCNWLSEQVGLTPCYTGRGKVTKCDFSANGYRLPTEAEWEFAARGGTSGGDTLYAGADNPDEIAWYSDNSAGKTHPVGQKRSNVLGLYDMSGNVWEWCWDKYLEDYYTISPAADPPGPEKGQENKYLGGWERSRRGGAFNEAAYTCRNTFRSFDGQSYQGFASGFRLVRNA